MLSEHRFIQFGEPRKDDIKCIVVHNTSNYDKSARELFNYLEKDSKDSKGCHFLVDYKEVIEVLPLDWVSYNTGRLCYGDYKGIAIEICSNRNLEVYLQGEQRAINLIKDLMKKYNLTEQDIYFHRSFNPNVNCPATIIERYGNLRNFRRTIWK